MASFREYADYDAMGLADLVRRGEVTPLELVEAAIERIERHNGALNAVVHRMYDSARAAAAEGRQGPKGPFEGVPFLVKDLLQAVRGAPLTSSCRMTRDYVPRHDGELVKRYRAAGLLILGKTNTPELGIPPYTEPELHGATRNPWDLTRTPGGSSGGSAAAVAARIVPMAHGGDGGGSIRIPASCCGVFGMKPTRARTPAGPDHGDNWQGCAVEHVLSRSVRDSAAALDATAGPDSGAPYWAAPHSRPFLDEVTTEPGKLRIAFTSYPFLGGQVAPDCKAALDSAVRLAKDLGHEVEEARPAVDRATFTQAFLTMLAAETAASVDDMGKLMDRRPTSRDFEASTWVLAEVGRHLSAADYAAALRELRAASRRIAPFFDRYDILMTPTLARPPVEIGELQSKGVEGALLRALHRFPVGVVMKRLLGPLGDKSFEWVPFTPVFNVTGQPAMSVPLYTNAAGLPIGVQFVGRYADEARLFRLAGQLERAHPWAKRTPPGFG